MPEEALETMPPGITEDALVGMMQTMMLSSLIITLIFTVLTILIFWKIFSKAGYSGWLSLTMLIPIVNLVVLLYVAFAEWPISRQSKEQSQA